MSRPAIAPFLVTGVVLVGAAAVVANPVVLPPADIRVSAADYAADGKALDLLDPVLLESIGASGQSRQTPVEILESLLSGLVQDSDVDPSFTHVLAGGVDVGKPDLLMATLAAISIGGLQADGIGGGGLGPPASSPGIFGGLDPVGGAREVIRALAEIGEGFGAAGVAFIQQIGMAPAVVAELARQVQAGTMQPDEALRRLVAVPLTELTGSPQLTGNPEIDAPFTTGVLRPVVDALANILPAGGPIVTVNDESAKAATDVSNSVAPSTPPSSIPVAAGDDQTTGDAVTEPPLAPAAPEAEPADDGNKNDVDDTMRGNGPPSGKPGRAADDFGSPILTGAGGHKPGKGAGSSGGSPGSAAGGKGSSAGN